MSLEVLFAGGYAAFLLVAAATIEWLSAHTHRRSLRYVGRLTTSVNPIPAAYAASSAEPAAARLRMLACASRA